MPESVSPDSVSIMLVLLSALFLLLQGGAASPLSRATVASPKSSSEDYLLPTDIVPNHYNIELEPDFENDVFNGSVSIEFTVINATRYFYFHRRELDLNASIISLFREQGTAPSVSALRCNDNDVEICTVTFSDELIAGLNYTLNIDGFWGILNLDNAGFYLAKYEDEEGVEV